MNTKTNTIAIKPILSKLLLPTLDKVSKKVKSVSNYLYLDKPKIHLSIVDTNTYQT